MGLLLPPKVQAEIQKAKWEAERQQRRAQVMELIDFEDPVCREWQPVLEALDPHLRLGRAKPMAYAPGVVMRPGYYHWVRDNPTTVITVEPITGPDGESFAEPDSRLLESLRGNDLQNPRVYAALIERHEAREREQERDRAREREDIDAEVLERWKAVSETQISMNRSTPWSQNVAGRKGVRK